MAEVVVNGEGPWAVVEVTIREKLPPERERWLAAFLSKAEGVVYQQFNQSDMRLRGYGIYRCFWDNFVFWLGVSILQEASDD